MGARSNFQMSMGYFDIVVSQLSKIPALPEFTDLFGHVRSPCSRELSAMVPEQESPELLLMKVKTITRPMVAPCAIAKHRDCSQLHINCKAQATIIETAPVVMVSAKVNLNTPTKREVIWTYRCEESP